MICPVCGEKMREIGRHGVSVDICPGCKGVWLDRGELEKIIEFVSGAEPVPPAPDQPGPLGAAPQEQGTVRFSPAQDAAGPRTYSDSRWGDHRRHHDDDDDDHERHGRKSHHHDGDRFFGHDAPHGYDDQRQYHGKPHKKKSWFSEIFEVFGD